MTHAEQHANELAMIINYIAAEKPELVQRARLHVRRVRSTLSQDIRTPHLERHTSTW